MSDVFVSYKREDEERVGRLVRALEKHGVQLWWDRGLASGESWRTQIETALNGARCVVVIWSRESVGPQGSFVRDEASRGASRQILVPVLLDKVAPPLGFGELQAIDLSHWRGAAGDVFLLDLVAAIRAKLDGKPVPPPKGPMQRLLRRAWAGGLVSALGLAGAAFATNALNLQDQVCSAGVLSDSCGALGLGHRPRREEREAWASLPAVSDCEPLRQHLARFPGGHYQDVAQAALNAHEVVERWQKADPPLRLPFSIGSVEVSDLRPAATEAQAREQTLSAGHPLAEQMCRNAPGRQLKSLGVQIEPTGGEQAWRCEHQPRGYLCTLPAAQVVCEQEELIRSEQCRIGGAATAAGSAR